MSSARSIDKDIVAECHIGGKAGEIESDWKTIRATFHNFESFPHERGERVRSEAMECHGIQWRIFVYPRGHRSTSGSTKVSVALACVSVENKEETEVSAAFNVTIPSTNVHSNHDAFHRFTYNEYIIFVKDFAPRARVLDNGRNYLVGGALTIEVDIKVKQEQPKIWIPTNNISSDMLKLLESADPDTADALFHVGSGKKAGSSQEPCIFYAHLNILSIRCPTLAGWVDQNDPLTPVTIENVEPDIFQIVLHYIYAGELPDKHILKENAKAIVEAANFLSCKGLKLAAEAELTSSGIDVDSVAGLILFADATNCAMLKEAAMDYFVANAADVLDSDGYKDAADSSKILGEMLSAVTSGKKRPAPLRGQEIPKRLRVATLRQKLHKKGLDYDGSKETLVTRLEEQLSAEAAAEAENNDDEEEDDDEEVAV